MRWAALLVLASCNSLLGVHDFVADAAQDAPQIAIDAADAAPDGPGPACKVVAEGIAPIAGTIGNPNGGLPLSTIACPDGALPIGFRFDMSPNLPDGWNEPPVETVNVRCGTVVRTVDGSYETAPSSMVSVAGSPQNCPGWQQAALGAEIDCPSGSVLVTIHGNEDSNQVTGERSLFNSLSAVCAALDATGRPGGDVTILTYANTGASADAPQTVPCAGGTAMVQIAARGACGLDALTFGCAPTSCQ